MNSTIFPTLLTFSFIFTFTSAILTSDDEEFSDREADTYNWLKHPCRRKCSSNEQSKICHYVFVVEQFSSMSKACYDCPFNITDCSRPHCIPTDGVQKQVYVVNRQLPGPLIEVCENDQVIVEVRNRMLSESTAIHWHGINQEGTPFMDGVPHVTQCPISPGENFRYAFNATSTGTFFWHSHIGTQRADGLFGPMVVNQLFSENFHRNLYDYDEYTIIINDWVHDSASEAFVRVSHDEPQAVADNILINGLGRYRQFPTDNGSFIYTPQAVFNVEKNKRYRFRLINAGAEDCPIEMTIDNHTMTVISMDSHDIVSTEVDVITSFSGERVDFIIETNQTPNNYWIRFRGQTLCQINDTSVAHQEAILHYNDVTLQDPKAPVDSQLPKYDRNTRILNPYDHEADGVMIKVSDLKALDADDRSLSENVDQQIYISYNLYGIDNYVNHRKGLYGYRQVPGNRQFGTLQMNHISLNLPAFPLVSQWDSLKSDSFCNATHPPKNLDCTVDFCACTHVVQVKLNSVVEVVLVDEDKESIMFNHPYHLHGHFFRVIAEEKLNGTVTIDRIKQLDKEGRIKRQLNRAPLKDTINAMLTGYTVVRFYANNPGYWFFHCHFEQHMNAGMGLIFKVGEHEDFPKVPKGFPKCGGFTPSIM